MLCRLKVNCKRILFLMIWRNFNQIFSFQRHHPRLRFDSLPVLKIYSTFDVKYRFLILAVNIRTQLKIAVARIEGSREITKYDYFSRLLALNGVGDTVHSCKQRDSISQQG